MITWSRQAYVLCQLGGDPNSVCVQAPAARPHTAATAPASAGDLWDADYLPLPISQKRVPSQPEVSPRQQGQQRPDHRRRAPKTDMDLDLHEGGPLLHTERCCSMLSLQGQSNPRL